MAPSLSEGIPVFLNVYDVSSNYQTQLLNAIFANKSAPYRMGGIFHAGIEVAGREWTFGFIGEGSGVKCREPRTDPQHHYRESVRLPNTRLSEEDVVGLLDELQDLYMGTSYSLLQRNCCHFAEDFCLRLGVGPLPAWLHRWGRAGDSVRKVATGFEGKIGVLCPCVVSECGTQTPMCREKNSGDCREFNRKSEGDYSPGPHCSNPQKPADIDCKGFYTDSSDTDEDVVIAHV